MPNNIDMTNLLHFAHIHVVTIQLKAGGETFADAGATLLKLDRSCVGVVDNTASKEGLVFILL